jgi:hypothetical protein
MPRLHIFEWEDQAWFPALFRNFITDHLVFHVKRMYLPIVPLLSANLHKTGYTDIIDLCSGGGGPLPALVPKCSETLNAKVNVTLTDLYPNLNAFNKAKTMSNGLIDFRIESISAMECPSEFIGFRTMFSALHHFKPNDVKKILSDAAGKKTPIGVFEVTQRNFINTTLMPIVAFLGAFLITPFLGRMTIGRFVFTYVIPIAPFCLAWDGFVSCLRTYSPAELDEITKEIDCDAYMWESGKIPALNYAGPYNITYLFGIPCEKLGPDR